MSPEDVMVELRIKMHRDGTFSTKIDAERGARCKTQECFKIAEACQERMRAL